VNWRAPSGSCGGAFAGPARTTGIAGPDGVPASVAPDAPGVDDEAAVVEVAADAVSRAGGAVEGADLPRGARLGIDGALVVSSSDSIAYPISSPRTSRRNANARPDRTSDENRSARSPRGVAVGVCGTDVEEAEEPDGSGERERGDRARCLPLSDPVTVIWERLSQVSRRCGRKDLFIGPTGHRRARTRRRSPAHEHVFRGVKSTSASALFGSLFPNAHR
jgi:hypothetical protein